jgi:hypothetical protein
MNNPAPQHPLLLRRIRWLTALFILGLVLSGATALPLETELNALVRGLQIGDPPASSLGQWLARVQAALHDTNVRYPFIAYGADWLAFGHFMIALVFVWAWRDPVRNRWLFDYGLLACALVIPYALVLGGLRGIPLWWRAVDCSFGVFAAIPLWFCRRDAARLAESQTG